MDVAIIPARGGSKRIPGKNIRTFHGRPMLAYAVEAARDSGLFGRIIVSSDDDRILAVAGELGALPVRRPADLADDHATTIAVIEHGLRWALAEGDAVEAACCIYPSVPFLLPTDLVAARRMLALRRDRFVFPVVRFPSPVLRALSLAESGDLTPFFPEHTETRTQDTGSAVHDAGQYYWGTTETWLSKLPIHARGVGVPIPPWRAVDIDTPEDWQMAERLYAATKLDGPDA